MYQIGQYKTVYRRVEYGGLQQVPQVVVTVTHPYKDVEGDRVKEIYFLL